MTPHGFKDATTDSDRIAAWWTRWPQANIAMPTGSISGVLVLDVDPRNGGDVALDDLVAKNGRLFETAEQISGGGGRHIFFRHPGIPVSKMLAPGIDLKADGGYVLIAPSIHPSGVAYEWDGMEGPKALRSLAEVPNWLRSQIDCTRQPAVQNHPGGYRWRPGERNNRLTSLAGSMRRRGMSRESIEAALFEENRRQCDPPLAEAEVRRIARSVGSYAPKQEPSQKTSPDEWPDPLPIQSELPPVQSFSEDLLPISFRALVRDVAERMQVPMDYPAVVVVLCLAGAVSRRASIQPKASDTGWVVVPNLWGGIIAPPGFMKSPIIKAITRSLESIEAEKWQMHQEALVEYEREKDELELRHCAWKEQYKASVKGKKQTPARPEELLEKPILKRLIVNDATFEALHQTMSENPAGILVIRDELTGWWSQLDREGRQGERAFCLEAWNGNSPFTIDRIGRGTVRVEACCMSMLGGIQPGRLRSYLTDALEDGPGNDGLIQRFQLLVWPDTSPGWTYVDRAPNEAFEQQAAYVFRQLVELDVANPVRLRFSPEAQELLIEWLRELEAKVRSDELHPALIAHLSKFRSLMPSLALLFELADWATGSGSLETVSLEHAKQAAAWCEYLELQARRVYSCVVTPQLRAARELATRIKARKIAQDGVFSCREVYLKGWTGLDSPEAVKLAAEVLRDARWIREWSAEPGPQGGRPADRYRVNPKVKR